MKTPDLKWWQHIYWSVRNGEWSCGLATQKKWPGKPQLSVTTAYYDGYHWCIHIGPFYLGASYY